MPNKLFVNETDAIIDIICNKINDNLVFTCVVSMLVMITLYVHFWLIADSLTNIIKLLQLKKPGLVFISFRQGEDGMLKFVLVLPAPGAPDVVVREVKFSVGDQAFDLTLAGDLLETPEMSGNDNDQVVGTLVDVDDAGNKSEAREFTFTLVDTLAPPQPGELGFKITGEE